MGQYSKLNYDPTKLDRELKKHYIAATSNDEQEMLKTLNIKSLDDLYAHIPEDIKFKSAPKVCEELSYDKLISHLDELSKMNKVCPSFIGDGLKNYKETEIVPFVLSLRNLTTAYTPYQPERSQGTLQTLWVYSSTISMLTGFEAINASFYDRSTCAFEAINTAIRLVKNSDTALVCESIFPGDIEVLKTHAKHTLLNIVTVPIDKKTGTTSITELKKLTEKYAGKLSCILFPQVNALGNLEDVNFFTDYCKEQSIQSIAMIDPMLIATEGLLPPSQYGKNKTGANMFVAEGQHLAIAPNFGGPGLGIFGIRYNENNKNDIRSTAGRFVGKARDEDGKECLCMVLSTREQHIRREKATSNICSNQSYIATVAGASILARGETGMKESHLIARDYAVQMAQSLTEFKGVKLAFPNTPFYNEFVLELPMPANELIKKAINSNLEIGVDVSNRVNDGRHLLLLSFFDVHTDEELDSLYSFFKNEFEYLENDEAVFEIPTEYKRTKAVMLPDFSIEDIKKYYQKLNDINVSPDDNIYPLGSCTMKYNPYINDWAAGLSGFTRVHPQSPIENVQGSLKILFEIQEIFKSITGLPAVTTQPVAGAQGELVGLKLFQAYHADRGEGHTRNIILIPKSAHGTNPATATMAGYRTYNENGVSYGIVTIQANGQGQIDMEQVKKLVEEYSTRIAAVMVTNPNTSGIFETDFKKMSDLIHSVGGLVYMDGANMNAIAGWVDLDKMGVDAVHNNLHKTWSIPHGGGGPGDGIVAVSEKLIPYLPGHTVIFSEGKYTLHKAAKSIGEFHRHFGNFAHKIRAYTYIKALGEIGTRRMSGMSVLAARYLYSKLQNSFPILPENTENNPRMHEFILTLSKETFDKIEKSGTPKASTIARVGKLFLDFGGHAPTVAFPEVYGLMIEPTETYSKLELDKFVEVVNSILALVNENPEVLKTAPHFTPVKKVDEVYANKELKFMDNITELFTVFDNVIDPIKLSKMETYEVASKIREVNKSRLHS